MTFFRPAQGGLRGTLTAPPDKSISHRAALLAGMTSDPVRVTNYLEAADTLSTLAAVQALGAIVERRADELVFRGPGLRAAAQPTGAIDVGNAGPLLRLLPARGAAADRVVQRGHVRHTFGAVAGLARGPARGRVDPRRRRVRPAAPGQPHRRAAAADGRPARRARGALHAADDPRHAPR